MAQKFLRLSSGRIKELEAIQTSAGAGDAGKIAALDAAGKFDVTMMPTGVGPQTKSIIASEGLASGDYVNVWDNSGTVTVRKADATAVGKEADGFVLAAVLSGAAATVYFNGENTGQTGLTKGSYHYLSAASPGMATVTPPSTAGNIVQILGRAVSTTEIPFNPLTPVELV